MMTFSCGACGRLSSSWRPTLFGLGNRFNSVRVTFGSETCVQSLLLLRYNFGTSSLVVNYSIKDLGPVCGGHGFLKDSRKWPSSIQLIGVLSTNSKFSTTKCRDGEQIKPLKVTNRRSKGIVPIGEDYGGYDEDKHEEYEKNAETRQARIKWLKKIASTVAFSSILGTVVWARHKKQKALEEITKDVKFLPRDNLFSGSYNTFCEVQSVDGSSKVVVPTSMVTDGTMKYIQNEMTLKPDDVVVASFPKTGTTWVQEIVYLIKNNLDFDKAKASVLEDRFPFLEYPYPGVKSVDKMKSPRLIKTHLPYSFLPKNADQAKIIYMTRNPKDTAVSYYHFARMLSFLGYEGSFDQFLEKFENDQVPFCPFFDHIESFLKQKDDPNVLILTFEELKKSPAETVQKIAAFLEKSLTYEEILKIVDHTKFEKMALNPSVNYEHWNDLGIRKKNEAQFMRKGKVGDWRNYFSPEQDSSFDEWVKEKNKFNFRFDYNN